MNEGSWSAFRTILLAAAAGYAGNNAALHAQLTQMIGDLYVAGPALVALVTAAVGIYKNWNVKKVPVDSVAVSTDAKNLTSVVNERGAVFPAKVVGALLFALMLSPAIAADVAVKAPVYAATPAPCSTAGDCSGLYGTFGVGLNANLGATLTNGSAANNGESLNFGGGYQVWKGQLLAGIEVTGGYQFGTAGNSGSATSTQFVKLGYNFFPSTATGSATPSQNPFSALVPANLLANSTPALLFGGALGHGIEKAAIGAEVDTVIAAGWSTAFQWYNAPSVKGQSDENVFRVMVQKHF